MSATANVLVGLAISLLALASYLRWWRVAQREHYEPGRLLAMAAIWCRAQPTNLLALAAVLVLCLVGLTLPLVGALGALVWLLWPPGLALLRPSKPLVWTARVRRLVVITVVLHVVVTGVFLAVGAGVSLVPLLALPMAEVGLLAAHPVEDRLSRRYEVSAAAKIKQVAPRVVAITGSYGKTSTKNYAAHLIAGRWSVLASPASFNNVMGLSRAVNDRLVPGTDVFVAEMGTYGPGEIAALCRIFPPEVSAITTIGEAHLERMRDRATIVRAKSEILEPARTVVLNVDVPELEAAADLLAALEGPARKRVIRCATSEGAAADVVVRRDEDGWLLELSGEEHRVTLPAEVGHPINVAVAVGLALALDVPEKAIRDRLASVPATPHRAETTTLATGITVIDDTYNANPEGAAQALVRARSLVGEGGTVWTITPGMVELGPEQVRRNADFARAATADEGMQLCIVGRTNRKALSSGEASRTRAFGSREEAVRQVMATAGSGDVVLYENDLPDHYP
jgi:UDP-N-acetylmuramoyl-tripeptide--D-alanyl-D-alanine ligase